MEAHVAETPADKPKRLSVHGKVTNVFGKALIRYSVEVEDVDLRHEQFLGRTYTCAPDGRYSILYSPDSFRRAEKGSADLKVYVFGPDQKSSGRKPVAVSQIMFNAPDDATIDIVVGDAGGKSPSEYDLLMSNIEPLLDGAKIEDLLEDDTHHD